MKKKILLTRQRAASERLALVLGGLGYEGVVEPLLTIVPTDNPRPSGSFQAVMITSANALDVLRTRKEEVVDLLSVPCFCVGATTGEVARAFGFTQIHCGGSDSAALAQSVTALLTDKAASVLHIAGEHRDDKAHDILTRYGLTLSVWVVYDALAAMDFTPETRALFAAGSLGIVPVFSSRTARILVSIIEKNHLAEACRGMTAIGLSQAVANVLQTLPWQHVRVAAASSEEAVLACLPREATMTTPEPLSPPPVPPPVSPVGCHKGRCFLWSVLGVVVLSGAGAVALLECPWGQAILKDAQPSVVQTQDVSALEQRVQKMESRLDALAEAASVPVPPSNNASASDLAALTETVKNVQEQVTQAQSQSQIQTRKSLAKAFALWDLRDVARNGHAFASQLAALRSAAVDDGRVMSASARLEPYALTDTPTFAQLREQLVVAEASIPPVVAEASSGWWEHIKTIMRNLVSVHPLHNPQFVALENALDGRDASVALETFKSLPPEVQQHLTVWHDRLQARVAIDAALHEIEVLVTAVTSEQGTAP